MVQKLSAYEQRHPDVYQDKFKRVVTMVDAGEDEGATGEQEVAVAEWTRAAGPVTCKWVKPPGPPRGFDFDVTKTEQIFDLLLAEKHIKIPEGHKVPTMQELNGKPYCKWHNTFTHTTNDCRVWRQQIQMAIENGRLIFNQYAMKVDTHPFPAVNMVELTHLGGCQPDFSANINMVELGHPSEKGGDEDSYSHSKDTEEAAPCDRLRQDGKRYEGEVKNIRYQRPLSDHLLNKYVSRGFDKLIRRISHLNKKDPVPSSCRVEPYSSANPLPENHPTMASFLPFPRMEKSKNKLSLPKTTKVLLFMKVKSQPMIKDLIRIGSQFIGYREYANRTEEKLAEANKRAGALVQKLEQSEAARKKAELAASEAKAEADEAKAKVASVEELQKRLEDAESALNEHKTAQAAREEVILKRLKSQIRRTETQTNQGFDLENPVNDPLLDTLSYLELHGSEIREGVANASAGLSTLFPYFFPKKEEPPFPCPCQELQFIRRPWTEEELKELRVQLQSVKKQSLMLMEQSRESSQREKIALQQAQDAMTEKDAAVAEAAAATSRENSMLQLLIDASLDMAAMSKKGQSQCLPVSSAPGVALCAPHRDYAVDAFCRFRRTISFIIVAVSPALVIPTHILVEEVIREGSLISYVLHFSLCDVALAILTEPIAWSGLLCVFAMRVAVLIPALLRGVSKLYHVDVG
ncbi:hypothetical protein QYE76_057488 [Lolium multiflorum]|uniref:Uncharacterized protein n=1 Tax=Lolium multiflorum TaxID=4521 RepID=A0AAD8T4R4_LOLMU|nr:hypothetical protein QYE76_057488 [Lolium multiflorum]